MLLMRSSSEERSRRRLRATFCPSYRSNLRYGGSPPTYVLVVGGVGRTGHSIDAQRGSMTVRFSPKAEARARRGARDRVLPPKTVSKNVHGTLTKAFHDGMSTGADRSGTGATLGPPPRPGAGDEGVGGRQLRRAHEGDTASHPMGRSVGADGYDRDVPRSRFSASVGRTSTSRRAQCRSPRSTRIRYGTTDRDVDAEDGAGDPHDRAVGPATRRGPSGRGSGRRARNGC